MEKIPVGILGATGMVGQKFIECLKDHPWFEITCLAASERSLGKSYGEVVKWMQQEPLPEKIANMTIVGCVPEEMPCRVVFSGLDSSVAGEIEENFAKKGFQVISNSSNHRQDKDVPLLIPEVNPDHLQLLPTQTFSSEGHIVTNPNCSVIGIAMALKPLVDKYSLESLHTVTLQALSGAGYPGVPSMDIVDNVIPFIDGEESKVEKEPKKILGKYNAGAISEHPLIISAQCNRVGVSEGHVACIALKFKEKAQAEDIISLWRSFRGEPQRLGLPSAPKQPIFYWDDERFPQPKRHRNLEKGMAISIGRLQKISPFDWKFVVLSHNTIRGAAGCAVLNAELMFKKGYLR